MGVRISTENLHFNLQQGTNDYDHRLVRKLIRSERLAICYIGLSEEPSEPPRFDDVVPASHRNTFLSRDLVGRRIDPKLYDQVIECPICLLYYPVFINYSRCCNQPICTECFLKLKRSPRSPLQAPACPFCVEPNFGVIYIPPSFTDHDQKRQNDPSLNLRQGITSSLSNHLRLPRLAQDDRNVVLVDSLRPNWHKMVEAGIGAGNVSGHGTTRRRIVRLGNHHTMPTQGHIRVSDSPYYGNSVAWQRDESALVMNDIRTQEV